MVSLGLFMLTLLMTVTMATDFFRLNRQVEMISHTLQSKWMLADDLVRQAKIETTLRHSVKDARNMALRNCVFAPGTCLATPPQEFIMNSPFDGSPTIAGTTAEPVTYTKSGERCVTTEPDCDNSVISYFTVTSDSIEVWFTINLNPTAHVTVPINDVINFNYE